QEMGFQPLRDTKELNKGARVLPAMTLRDVGRDGSSGTPDLRGQAEHFVPRKGARDSVTELGQCQGVLPYPQIAIRVDWVFGQPAFLFAFPFSPFPTRRSTLIPTRYSLLALTRLLVPRQRIVRAFPWGEKIEVAEFLGEA